MAKIFPYAIKDLGLVPLSQAVVSAADLSVCRGYGVFDYFEVRNGIALFLPHYLERFRRSSVGLGLNLTFTDNEILSAIDMLIHANNRSSCGIRMLLTGGFSESSYQVENPVFFMIAYESPTYHPDIFRNGVRLMTQPFLRVFPAIKSINYLHGLYMQQELKSKGFDYLLYHFEGKLLESDRSNFFLLNQDNILYTAEDQVLHGITRKIVLEIANECGIEVRLQAPTLAQLRRAKSCFLTNTTAKLLPVCQIDDYILPECPGEVFVRLRECFANKIQYNIDTRCIN
jgi:branched-chain amino acid aminotransferase